MGFNPNTQQTQYDPNQNYQDPNQSAFNSNLDQNQSPFQTPQDGQANFNNNPNQQNNFSPYPNNGFDANAQQGYDPNQQYNPNYSADPNATQQYDPNAGFNPNAQQTQYDPNQPYDPNAQAYNPNQYQDVNQMAYQQDPYQDPNYNPAMDPNMGGYQNQYDTYGNDAQLASQQPPQKNSFKEKKTGNNFFLIISGIIAVILLGATIFLFWMLGNRDQKTTLNPINDQNDNQAEVVKPEDEDGENPDDKETEGKENPDEEPADEEKEYDPNKTPAENAKLREATETPADWLKQYFFNNEVDENGVCLNMSVCGIEADPDNDGLTNLEEYMYGTDPMNEDTSDEGIADGDEVYVYLTNPREKNSTDDTKTDSEKILACLDPIINNENKITSARLSQIAANIQLRPLREKTVNTLKEAGATDNDLKNGFVESRCNPVSIDF